MNDTEAIEKAEAQGAKITFNLHLGLWIILDQKDSFLWHAYFDSKAAAARAYLAVQFLKRAADKLQGYCEEINGDLNDNLTTEIENLLEFSTAISIN
jgi:hypothetical protein